MSLAVGVIGAGVMGADHARILREETRGAHLAAVCDADPARAAGAAQGAPTFTDAKALIAKADGSGVLKRTRSGTKLTVANLLELMLQRSDNTATNVLISTLGMEKITARMAGLGFANTKLRRYMIDLAAERQRLARAGRWAEKVNYMGMGVTGRTLGAIGMGNIGSRVGALARPARAGRVRTPSAPHVDR